MTAFGRISVKSFGVVAAATVATISPAIAQNSDQAIDVTASPPPTSDSVGPAQLRNFSLGGETTRPALPAPQQPATAAPTGNSTASAPARTNSPTTAPAQATPAPRSQGATGPAQAAPANVPPVSTLPTIPTEQSAQQVGEQSPPAAGPAPAVTPEPISPAGTFSPWPWLAGLLGVLAAAGLFWWTRRSREQRITDPGRLAFAGAVREQDDAPAAPRAAAPEPQPAPEPVTPAAPPTPPIVTPAPTPPAPAPTGMEGMITSSALKPSLTIRLNPDRLTVTGQDVTIQFDLAIDNVGSAPARDVLVEAIMVTASATQDHEIAEFFRNPRAQGDRIPVINPIDSLPLKSVVRLPLDKVSKFEAGGRMLFVPLIAFNLVYRAGSQERQNSASFLIGRGTDGDEKLAPFRLDLGPRIFRDLSARAHSAGLNA